jgi:hypothetical protein
MIWIFGDSFSVPFETHINNKCDWAIDYCNFKNKIPKVFGNVLSDLLKMNVTNLAIPGCDNYTMFHSYIKNIENIKKNDIVIFGWSNTLRYRLGNNFNKFTTIIIEWDEKKISKEFSNLSKNTLNELLMIRNSLAYYDELKEFIKIIKYSLPNNLIYNWSPFLDVRKNVSDLENIIPPSGINIETNGLVNDYHYGEVAHLNLAMYFYKKIKSIK